MQNNKIISTIFICTLLAAGLNAQNRLFFQDYQWDRMDWTGTASSAVEKQVLFFREAVEFSLEEDGFRDYYLLHRAEQVNSDRQIEQSNQIYIPYNMDNTLVEAKARVIKGSRQLMSLEESDILSSVDEETGKNYRYFALEGLEPGCIIEIYYVLRRPADHNGRVLYFQHDFPIREYHFDLLCPEHLVFDFRVLNDTNSLNHDTLYSGKNHWSFNPGSIDALNEEPQAPYNLLRKKILFKLDENRATGKLDFTNFGQASQNVYNNLFGNISKSDNRKFQAFLEESGIKASGDQRETVRQIEHYVKSNINVNEAGNASNSISDIIDTRNASSRGITSLFSMFLKTAGIPHEIVLTCDRTENRFETDFESFHFLQDYLIYFPEIDEYLVPDRFQYRLGIVPYGLTDNNGLFIHEVTLGNFTTGIGEVRYIPPLDYQENCHDHKALVKFTDGMDQTEVRFEQISLGYYATPFQAYLENLDKEKLHDLADDMIHTYFNDFEVKSWEFNNATARDVGVNPLILTLEGKTADLIEYAGNNIILKIGELIGPQVEMYSEEERKLPVYDIYKRSFTRYIEIEIPEGYSVRNNDDVNMFTEFKENGRQKLLFESSYKYQGNKLIINISEYYDKLSFALGDYAEYRSVVNSAADFNKVKLILEKTD